MGLRKKTLIRYREENLKKQNKLHSMGAKKIKKVAKIFGTKVYQERILYPFIVDFYMPTLNLAIEIDGGIHKDRAFYDERRDNEIYKKRQITVLRFDEATVRALDFRHKLWALFYMALIKKVSTINNKAHQRGIKIPECLEHIRPFGLQLEPTPIKRRLNLHQ